VEKERTRVFVEHVLEESYLLWCLSQTVQHPSGEPSKKTLKAIPTPSFLLDAENAGRRNGT